MHRLKYYYFSDSQSPNHSSNPSPQSSDVVNQRRTSLHPLEEVELNRRVKRKRTSRSSTHGGQLLSADENNDEENQSQRSQQQSTAGNKNTTLNIRMPSLYEGYSSVTSIDSRYLDSRRTNEKWKEFLVFMYTEPSIMFYSNIFLMVSKKWILYFFIDEIDIIFLYIRYRYLTATMCRYKLQLLSFVSLKIRVNRSKGVINYET